MLTDRQTDRWSPQYLTALVRQSNKYKDPEKLVLEQKLPHALILSLRQGGPEKTAQGVLHENFATVTHNITWLSPKMFRH